MTIRKLPPTQSLTLPLLSHRGETFSQHRPSREKKRSVQSNSLDHTRSNNVCNGKNRHNFFSSHFIHLSSFFLFFILLCCFSSTINYRPHGIALAMSVTNSTDAGTTDTTTPVPDSTATLATKKKTISGGIKKVLSTIAKPFKGLYNLTKKLAKYEFIKINRLVMPNEGGYVSWTVENRTNEWGQRITQCSAEIDYHAAFLNRKLGHVPQQGVRIVVDRGANKLVHTFDHIITNYIYGGLEYSIYRKRRCRPEKFTEDFPIPSKCTVGKFSAYEVKPVYNSIQTMEHGEEGEDAFKTLIRLHYVPDFVHIKKVDYSELKITTLGYMGTYPEINSWYSAGHECSFSLVRGNGGEANHPVLFNSIEKTIMIMPNNVSLPPINTDYFPSLPVCAKCSCENPEDAVYSSRSLTYFEEKALHLSPDLSNGPFDVITVQMPDRDSEVSNVALPYVTNLILQEVINENEEGHAKFWSTPAHTEILTEEEIKEKQKNEDLIASLRQQVEAENRNKEMELKLLQEDETYAQEQEQREAEDAKEGKWTKYFEAKEKLPEDGNGVDESGHQVGHKTSNDDGWGHHIDTTDDGSYNDDTSGNYFI